MTTLKTCTKCGQEKQVSLFGYHSQGENSKRPVCKACHAGAQKARYHALSPEKKEKFKSDNRSAKLKRKFGIDSDEYEKILRLQGGLCALCKRLPEHSGNINFAVDHCHDTGAVRGLLCRGCNLTLGRMGDSAEAIRRVLEYIETPLADKCSEAVYKGLWGAIIARAAEMSPDVPIYKRDLDRWIAEIWEAQPDAKAAYALNTTLYGREGEKA